MKKELKKTTILLLTLLVMLLWGSLFPVIKLGYEAFSIRTEYFPNLLLFAGVRFVICGAVIVLIRSVKGKRVPTFSQKKQWLGVILLGLIAVSAHYACTYIGLSKVDSSKTSLLKQSGVLFFVCFSFLFIKEDTFSITKLLGAVLGAVSIVLLNCGWNKISFRLGEALIVLASVCTVASNVVCKKMLGGTNALDTTGYFFLFGGGCLLIVALSLGGKIDAFTWKGALLLLYIILATIVSYSLWYWLVQNYDLSKLFIIKLSEPIFTLLISMLLLGEKVWRWQYLLSIVCIALAMLVSNLKIKPKSDKAEEPTEE